MTWHDKFKDEHNKKGLENLLQGKPKQVIDQVHHIIDQLKKFGLHSNSQEIECLIILWLKSILERFESGAERSFDALTLAQQAMLDKELQLLIDKLEQAGVKASADELKKLLINGILESYEKVRQEKELEIDWEFLTEKDKKRIKEELIRAAIYELYKMLNPNRLAGETKMENFINNMIMGGFKRASKYEGGRPEDIATYNLPRGFLDVLAETNKLIIKNPNLLNEWGKDMSHISGMGDPEKGGRGGRGM